MEHITIEQIKAARALLNWTQEDLGDQTGLNKAIIANYESDRTRALDVQHSIYHAFIAHGIQFVDGGVLPQHVSTKLMDGLRDVLNDAEKTLSTGDVLYMHCVNQAQLTNEEVRHLRKLEKNGVQIRLTVPDNGNLSPLFDNASYIKIPSDYFVAMYNAIIVYNNKVCLSVEGGQRLLITSEKLANQFKREFDYWWDHQ
jgi:DNA-binding XRE family transcriptional regulator